MMERWKKVVELEEKIAAQENEIWEWKDKENYENVEDKMANLYTELKQKFLQEKEWVMVQLDEECRKVRVELEKETN